MKANEITKGGKYIAKVSGVLTTVRVDEIRETSSGRMAAGGYTYGTATVYDVTNLKTGRRTTFRSAAKFRQAVVDKPLPEKVQKHLDEVLAKRKQVVSGSDQPNPEGGFGVIADYMDRPLVERQPESVRLERSIHQLSDEAHRGVITKEQHGEAFNKLIQNEAAARGVQLPQTSEPMAYSNQDIDQRQARMLAETRAQIGW